MLFFADFCTKSKGFFAYQINSQSDLPKFVIPELKNEEDECIIRYRWLSWDPASDEYICKITRHHDTLIFAKYDECPLFRFNSVLKQFKSVETCNVDQDFFDSPQKLRRQIINDRLQKNRQLKESMKYVVVFNNCAGNVYSKVFDDSLRSAKNIVDSRHADQAIIFQINDDRSLTGLTFVSRG